MTPTNGPGTLTLRTALGFGALALLALQAVAPVHATTLVHQDLRGLVRGSSDIVVGRVGTVRARWDDARRHIVTDVTFEVGESLKGVRRRLTLTQLGGEVDGMRLTVPASPSFRPGEEALLFVWRDARGRAQVNGLGQGKFEIRREPTTGAMVLGRNLPGLEVGDLRTLRAPRAGRAAARIPLEWMLAEIRRLVGEER